MAWNVSIAVREGGVHGKGVFAAEAIPVGTLIWEVDPDAWTGGLDDLLALPPQELLVALRDSYLHVPSDKVVWLTDGMQFMNHGPIGRANVGVNDWRELQCDHLCAFRDIASGEELLEDYNFWAKDAVSPDHWLTRLYQEHIPERLAFLRSLAERRSSA